jgi:hypothetical protein
MKIVINSHIRSEKAITHLLKSMRANKDFYDFNIIIFIGGHYNESGYNVNTNENITYIKCNHNSIDFTSLIGLLEIYESKLFDYILDDYYFYMHDTCKIGKNFFNKISSINLENVSSLRIKKIFSMNIGVYSQKIINDFKNFLLTKKNTEENRCMEFKSINNQEDYIFDNDENNRTIEDYNNNIRVYKNPVNYYNNGTMRIVEYYPNIDLYKIKANWNQGWTLEN